MQISATKQKTKYFVAFFRQKSNGKRDRAVSIIITNFRKKSKRLTHKKTAPTDIFRRSDLRLFDFSVRLIYRFPL